MPELESNTRLAQQLAQLAKGSALLDGRAEVNEDDFALVRRVAFDSMLPLRRAIIEALWRSENLQNLTIMRDTGPQKVPDGTKAYAAQDLETLNLIHKVAGWKLTEYAVTRLEQAGEVRPPH